MKKTSKIAAMIAAMALTAAMCVPTAMMSASAATDTTSGNSITVTNQDDATHTYAAYQIFSGNYSGDTLNDIAWGDGVNGTNLLSALQTASTTTGHALYGLFPAATVTDAKKVAEVLGSKEGDPASAVFGDDSAKAQAFAEIVAANLTTQTSGTYASNVVSNLPDGYYLIMDTAAPSGGTNNTGAKTRFIVKVSGDEDITVNAKHSAPTVDKLVQDEAADKDKNSTDADGWGETADHAINEEFDFKLVATLAKDADYAAYDTYRVLFTDTLNAGVTYDRIKSVKVNGVTVDAYVAAPATGDDERTAAEKAGYLLTAPTYNATTIGGGTLTISIGDIKQWLGSTAWADTNDSGVTVEVIYTAHLNENATVEHGSNDSAATTYNNVNKVKLNYSNNPNVEGSGDSGDTPGGGGNNEETGETPEDYVWVFTYEVDNTKYHDSATAGNELAGAGFRLYDSTGNTEIGLIYDSTLSAYRPVKSGEAATEMTSATTTGKFDIKGLDAGTYVLKETTVPSGYNKCDDITITIEAVHEENTGGSTAKLTFSGSNATNNIVNNKGSALPSTGGMGTTLFIVCGSLTAAAAGVYLVSKKRAKEEDAQ